MGKGELHQELERINIDHIEKTACEWNAGDHCRPVWAEFLSSVRKLGLGCGDSDAGAGDIVTNSSSIGSDRYDHLDRP